jgi:23S rRNA pseudouridine2605 synthase
MPRNWGDSTSAGPPPRDSEKGNVPLERALSKLGIASRRQTLQWIAAGEIEVDGAVCRDPRRLVCPERSAIRHRAALVSRADRRVIMLNKPRGLITSRDDEQGRPTVYSLLPSELHSLHCVGRLDQASSGLLLLTNDTRLSAWLTDPASRVPRVYIVTVRGEMTEAEATRMCQGIADGGDLLQAGQVVVRKASRRESHLVVTLTEGKNREIRRLCKACGHEVTRLKRVAFGNLSLRNLQPGQFRDVSPDEVGEIMGPPGGI